MTTKEIIKNEWQQFKGITIIIVVFILGIIKFAYVG